MKSILLAIAFVLLGFVAPIDAMGGNPVSQGIPATDMQLAQVKGSGIPDPWLITPYDQAAWVRFQMNLQCGCLSPHSR